MTQGQTERLIRDMREYAEEYRGSVLGDCLDALLQYVADLQDDNDCLLQQRDAAKTAQVTNHCPRCEEYAGQLAEALALVQAQARAEERYVAMLANHGSDCPWVCDLGCVKGDEFIGPCGKDLTDGERVAEAATCWRLWARAEEAAK